ncbi:MAG: tetratricopeptide repeat protein, partial [Candidatus Omnitrophica bacterium]|nr:tetratricopeptide repeat protein [Candidatus Omnitrophota bacterium]
YSGLRVFLLGNPFNKTLSLINEAGVFQRVYTLPRIIFTALQLIIAPRVLQSEFHFVVQSFRDPYVWLGVPFLILIFVLMYKFLKPRKHVIFFSCWFLIGLLPYSNILIPLHATFMGHWVYFSSMAVAALISMAIFNIREPRKIRYLVAAILIIVMPFYAIKIMERNKEWADPFLLYQRDVEREPNSFLLHCNLGVEYFRRDMMDEAKREFIASNSVSPGVGYDVAYNNLGVIYAREGDMRRAISCYKSSILLNNYALSYANLGQLYNNLKMHKDAAFVLKEGAGLYPLNVEIRYQLGVAYYKDGQALLARKLFQEVEEMHPGYSQTRMYLKSLHSVIDGDLSF